MKNKHIKISLLIIVVILMILAGLMHINKYYDILENGDEYKLECLIDNINSYSIRKGRITIYTYSPDFPYREKFSLVENKIESEIKRTANSKYPKKFPFNIFVDKKISASISKDDEGFMKIDSISENTKKPFVMKLCRGEFEKWDKTLKAEIRLDNPYLTFDFVNFKESMRFNENSIRNLQKYVNKLSNKERKGYAIVKVLDNNILLIDAFINGKSLKEIANK